MGKLLKVSQAAIFKPQPSVVIAIQLVHGYLHNLIIAVLPGNAVVAMDAVMRHPSLQVIFRLPVSVIAVIAPTPGCLLILTTAISLALAALATLATKALIICRQRLTVTLAILPMLGCRLIFHTTTLPAHVLLATMVLKPRVNRVRIS